MEEREEEGRQEGRGEKRGGEKIMKDYPISYIKSSNLSYLLCAFN